MRQGIKPWFLGVMMVMAAVSPGYGAEMEIVCLSDGCKSPGGALFEVNEAEPGQSTTKTVEIVNQSGGDLELKLKVLKDGESDDDFIKEIEAKVNFGGGEAEFEGSLEQLIGEGAEGLMLENNERETAEIELKLKNIGNQFQGKTVKFDLSFELSGGAGVLGQSAGGVEESEESEEGEVLGESAGGVEECQKVNWWWLLLVQAVLSLGWAGGLKVKGKSWLKLVAVPIVLAGGSQLGHQVIGCGCDSDWCQWYWMANLVELGLSSLVLAVRK